MPGTDDFPSMALDCRDKKYQGMRIISGIFKHRDASERQVLVDLLSNDPFFVPYWPLKYAYLLESIDVVPGCIMTMKEKD